MRCATSAMPTRGDRLEALADTSVAVALLVEDHEHHHTAVDAVGSTKVGLAGHAVFETYSVLTRLPAPLRRAPDVVVQLLVHNFPVNRYLTPDATAGLLSRLSHAAIGGGSVYDGLVAAVALESSLPLFTCDRRALPTYRAFEVAVVVVG